VQIEQPCEAALVRETAESLGAPPACISGSASKQAIGLVGAETNGGVRAINALLAEGSARVSRLTAEVAIDGQTFGPGSYLIEGANADALRRLAGEHSLRLGLARGDLALPQRRALRRQRLALYRSYRPNAMDEGRARFVLERYGFDFVSLRDHEVRQGGLHERLDCIILAHQAAKEILEGNSAREYPAEFSGGIGEHGVAHLRRFVEDGGTLIALDGACDLAIEHLYLPVTNALAGIKGEQFYAPGALFRIIVDPDHPLGWGFERDVAAMYLNGPAFDLGSAAETEQPLAVARYPLSSPLLSGWVLGPGHIAGKATIVEAPVGRGRAILFGFRPHFRAQMRGTYRLLFNAIYRSALD
jgi:hypothetical protein